MKKINFIILWLIYILNFNSNQELIKDICERSNGGSNIIKNLKNVSILINLSLVALNIKNFKDLIKKHEDNKKNEKVKDIGFLNKIKNYFKGNKTKLLTIFGTLAWTLIYFRTIHPLFKNRQEVFNFSNKIENENLLDYGNYENENDIENADFILVPGTKAKNPFDFLKHSFGFSSNHCNGHEVYEKGENGNNIDDIKLIKKLGNKVILNWNRNLCINDRKDTGTFLSKYMKNNTLNNQNKNLILEGVSYGNEVIFNALENLINDKDSEEKLKNKESTFLMAVPPTNERYLKILDKFLGLNSKNKIITLNNFNEETLLVDISNRKKLFDFGKAQSDLAIFQNQEFYKKNKDRILGLMSVDKNNNKEITHHELAEFSAKNGNSLINFIKNDENKIKFGNNYFISNFYQ